MKKDEKITKLTGPQKISMNRGIAIRIPVDIVESIEKISTEYYQTLSNIVRNQLIKFVRWDIFEDKIKLIPIPINMMDFLIKNKTDTEIKCLAKEIFTTLKEWTILTKEDWGLNQCIESLEDYMRIAKIESSHKIILDDHVFEIRHNLDEKWSIFGMYLFQDIFKEFSKMEGVFKFTPGALQVKITLGKKFNEHEY